MNICGISRVNYWHDLKGGMDVHGKIFSEGLVRRGHRVSIISTRHPMDLNSQIKNGVRINYLSNTVFGSRRRGWSTESELLFLENHKQQPFDIIWSQSFDGFGLVRSAKGLNLPIIATLHGSIEQELKTFTTNFQINSKSPVKFLKAFLGLFYSYFFVQKPLLHSADKIIAVSDKVTIDLKKWYGDWIEEKCKKIPNGIDTDIFKPSNSFRQSTRDRLGICRNEIVFLTLGRLTLEKGHHIALEAIKDLKKQFKDIRLLIVGEGNIRERLENQVKDFDLDSNVHFIGPVDNEQTFEFYNAADIFLMPTLTIEGLPFVLLEAMACAKPVIASRIGGNDEVIIDEVNGQMFQPGNVKELTYKIKQLIDQPELRKKYSFGARRTIENKFSANNMIRAVENILDSSISKTKI